MSGGLNAPFLKAPGLCFFAPCMRTLSMLCREAKTAFARRPLIKLLSAAEVPGLTVGRLSFRACSMRSLVFHAGSQLPAAAFDCRRLASTSSHLRPHRLGPNQIWKPSMPSIPTSKFNRAGSIDCVFQLPPFWVTSGSTLWAQLLSVDLLRRFGVGN
jgi:hypothetical protein